MSKRLAKARADRVVVEEMADEVLVYDLERHRVHCLNQTAAAIWRACDGRRDGSAIAACASRELGAAVDESVVSMALDQLAKARLLEGAPAQAPSRRQVVRAAVLLPAVVSILAPRAAQAATCRGRGQTCVLQSECCPGLTCRQVGRFRRCLP
jgi:hypothetical protein